MTKFTSPHAPRTIIHAPPAKTLNLPTASLQTTMERLQRQHPDDFDIRRSVVALAGVTASLGRDRVPKSAAWFAARSVYAQKTGKVWLGDK